MRAGLLSFELVLHVLVLRHVRGCHLVLVVLRSAPHLRWVVTLVICLGSEEVSVHASILHVLSGHGLRICHLVNTTRHGRSAIEIILVVIHY